MTLQTELLTFSQANRLFSPLDRILVAVSGGVDSVVLAHLMRVTGQGFAIAHVNFQLRGAESDQDEVFVRQLAADFGVPFFTRRMDTQAFAAEKGLSIQMAARALRYAWFEEIRAAEGFQVIATGHNRNDSIETALLHFIRGTGLTGLGGIPVRNGAVVRPLLFATRDAILVYATTQGLQWREDSSNQSEYYTRNAVRHQLMPRIRALNPAFDDTAEQTLRVLRDADANLQYLLNQLLTPADDSGVRRLYKAQLLALPAPQSALFDLLQPFGFDAEQVRQVLEGRTGTSWHSSSGYRLVSEHQAIALALEDPKTEERWIQADDLMVRLPDGSRMFLTPATLDLSFPDVSEAVLIDEANVKFPLLLRRWKPGDTFQPLGMGGQSQKIQDFFTNKKISVLEKETIWILEDRAQRIVWVVGHRLDERFKLTSKTTNALKISWLKQD